MTRPAWRRIAVWASLLLLVLIATVVVAGTGGTNTNALDPDNPEDGGMAALARVLEQQGVEVEVVRGLPDFTGTPVDADTTVLVVGTAYLGPDAGADVLEHARAADALLVLAPGPNVGEALDLPVSVAGSSTGAAITPECDVGTWREGERITGADPLIDVEGSGGGATVCFPPTPGYNAGGAMAGHVVQFDATGSRPRVLLLGLAQALTNGTITEEANAATGLRLLGATGRLVWYIPQVGDAGDLPPQSLIDVLPRAVVPATVIVLLALGALTVWRGRRLGPVVTEPLPAVIRSIETTRSRSRMYRRAQDRPRALASLQLAARRRLAAKLALPATASPAAVVHAVSAATGRHTGEVDRLLVDTRAPDDDTLVRIARELRSLEEGIGTR